MPTDHEEPCGPSHRSFCLNGGICYVIPTVPSPFCRCVENYTGARCEEVFLPSSSIGTKSNLFAAFVALAVLVTLTLAALYFLCRSWRTLKKHQHEARRAFVLQRQKVKYHKVRMALRAAACTASTPGKCLESIQDVKEALTVQLKTLPKEDLRTASESGKDSGSPTNMKR